MNHAFHLFIKFLLTSFILYGILGFMYQVDYTAILFTSVVLALAGYIGDIFLLPRLGNLFTTLSDFLLAFLIVWGIGTYMFDYDIGTQNYKANLVPLFEISLTIGALYAVVDWFYHRWLFKFLGKKEAFSR